MNKIKKEKSMKEKSMKEDISEEIGRENFLMEITDKRKFHAYMFNCFIMITKQFISNNTYNLFPFFTFKDNPISDIKVFVSHGTTYIFKAHTKTIVRYTGEPENIKEIEDLVSSWDFKYIVRRETGLYGSTFRTVCSPSYDFDSDTFKIFKYIKPVFEDNIMCTSSSISLTSAFLFFFISLILSPHNIYVQLLHNDY
jgi:hypothetical protein